MGNSAQVEEEKQLADCIKQIDYLREQAERFLNGPKDGAAVDGEAAREVRRVYQEQLKNLEEARPNPYFGRVNFKAAGSPQKTERYYIGKYHIRVKCVYSSWAPVARLFYRPLEGQYESGGGIIKGTVELKRELVIEEARLLEIIDYKLLPPGSEAAVGEEEPLTKQLAKPRGSEMHDIVVTIQPEQYEEIAATPEKVMIIQGVAGSGKSEVGLHRIAYLLSPDNELGLSIRPERVIFFGPSKIFLRYVSNLLPELDVQRVRQTTIEDWLKSTLSKRVRFEQRDWLLEKQLSQSKAKLDAAREVAKFKGSLEMRRLIDKHLQLKRKDLVNKATNLMLKGAIVISEAKVKRIVRTSQKGPLNTWRRHALAEIERELERKLGTHVNAITRAHIEAQFDRFWPELDFRKCYVELLSDRNALLAASKGLIADQKLDDFRKSLPKGSRAFRREDLPALCYLDHCLNDRINIRKKGQPVPLFQHVVIDEAQDVSPLEFLITYLHSEKRSFTILGDIAQCVLPHRGITNWHEAERVFQKESITRETIRISYRATYEITKYANNILKSISPRIPRPIPYKRHGEEPAFMRSKSYADMGSAIAADIRSLQQEEGIQTIAVLCKTSVEARRLHSKLVKEHIKDLVLMDRQKPKPSKTVVSSIYLTKGVEYDAVILANARKSNYPKSLLHGRLLYIAVTRAAHRLHIHWYGTLAEPLAVTARHTETGKIRVKRSRKAINKKKKRVRKKESIRYR